LKSTNIWIESYSGVNDVRRVIAPKGKQFRITGLYFHNGTALSGVMRVAPSYVEEGGAFPTASSIAVLPLDTAGDSVFIAFGNNENDGVLTKYISVQPSNASADCFIHIHYTLETLSVGDAIWEFVSKRS